MASTTVQFGDGIWGISSEQTGLLINSYSYDYKADSGEVKNRYGNTVGKTYFNQSVGFSIDGLVPSTSPWSTAIATSLTLSNGMSGNFLHGGLGSGTTILEGITEDHSNSDYVKLKISGTYFPFISA